MLEILYSELCLFLNSTKTVWNSVKFLKIAEQNFHQGFYLFNLIII